MYRCWGHLSIYLGQMWFMNRCEANRSLSLSCSLSLLLSLSLSGARSMDIVSCISTEILNVKGVWCVLWLKYIFPLPFTIEIYFLLLKNENVSFSYYIKGPFINLVIRLGGGLGGSAKRSLLTKRRGGSMKRSHITQSKIFDHILTNWAFWLILRQNLSFINHVIFQ